MPDQGAHIVEDKDDKKSVHIHVDKATLETLQVGDELKFKMQGSNCVITDVVTK
jgi:hypothetical protein